MADETEKPTITYVYTGVRLIQGGKKVHKYLEYHLGVAIVDKAGYFAKVTRKVPIGYMVRFETTETGIRGAGESLGRYHDREAIAQWTAEDAAARGVAELASKAGDELGDLLEPIRRVYARTNPQGRAALITKVILAIQRGL